MQESAYCRPENEKCVANQTLKNPKCLVPCEGLYADITDDFLSQNMVKMSQELYSMSQELIQSNERLHAVHSAWRQMYGGKMLFSPIRCNE